MVDIADKVIFAVGTGHQSNKAVQKRQKSVVEILVKSFQKCYCKSDEVNASTVADNIVFSNQGIVEK